MKLMIEEIENSMISGNEYILYYHDGPDVSTEAFDNYEDAVSAYKQLKGSVRKFLYQPDKRYFLLTLASTGFNYGKRCTVKATGLFIAKNINQIRKFLDEVDWRVFGGYRSDYSKFRIYKGGYGMKPVCSTDWDEFDDEIRRHLYDLKPYNFDKWFGALDISDPSARTSDIPFETYSY